MVGLKLAVACRFAFPVLLLSHASPPAVDFYSDTVTRPTPPMRQAMADAEVGDEQQREDPTVNRLQEMVAELLGKEAALFLPSGTMCNQISFAVHCRPGDEIILHETGASAALRGRRTRRAGRRRACDRCPGRAATSPPPRSAAPSILPCTTCRARGSSRWSRPRTSPAAPAGRWQLGRSREAAHDAGLACHMDGARLLNAVVATGTSAAPSLRRSTPSGSISPRAWAPRWARCWRGRATSSSRPGYSSSGSAARCGRPASWRRRASTRWSTTSSGWRKTTSGPGTGARPREHPGIEIDAERVETNIVIFDIRGTGADRR